MALHAVAAEPSAPWDACETRERLRKREVSVRDYCPFTPLYNTSGAPAISLPLGSTPTGLPIGVQLGAARGNDRLLLSLAASLEAARPWVRQAPRSKWARLTPQPAGR
jgi:amidase